MKIKSRYVVLIIIFLISLSARVFFSLQNSSFSDTGSYFIMREVEHIAQTGKPLIHDPLSYGGRTYVFMPLFPFLFAPLYFLFKSLILLKIFNNLLASTIVIAVYLVSSRVLKNRKISLVCALVAGFLPAYIMKTTNNLSEYSLMVPGTFFLFFLFLNLQKKREYLNYLLPLTAVMVLTSSSFFVILLSFLFFMVLNRLDKIETPRLNLEYFAFTTFFFLWTNFIIYKNAFQMHGFSVIWGNIPPEILGNYFNELDVLGLLASIGFLPFMFGAYTIYQHILKKKSPAINLFIGLFFASGVLFFLRLITIDLAVTFMGCSLIILFGKFLQELFSYLKKTKFAVHENAIFIFVILVLVATQVIPGIAGMMGADKNAVPQSSIDAYQWLSNNTPADSVVLGDLSEGNLITFYADRKDVADDSFTLIRNADVIVMDIGTIYRSKFKIEAIRLLDKYSVDYITVTDTVRKDYGIKTPEFIDSDCFTLVYNDSVQIYQKKDICGVGK